MAIRRLQGPTDPEHMAKMQAARAAKKAAHKTLNLLGEGNFDRSHRWDDVARARGIRLPDWNEPITVRRVRVWMNRLGVTAPDCAAYLGDEKGKFPGTFVVNNPRWPLRALVGTILESVCIESAQMPLLSPSAIAAASSPPRRRKAAVA